MVSLPLDPFQMYEVAILLAVGSIVSAFNSYTFLCICHVMALPKHFGRVELLVSVCHFKTVAFMINLFILLGLRMIINARL